MTGGPSNRTELSSETIRGRSTGRKGPPRRIPVPLPFPRYVEERVQIQKRLSSEPENGVHSGRGGGRDHSSESSSASFPSTLNIWVDTGIVRHSRKTCSKTKVCTLLTCSREDPWIRRCLYDSSPTNDSSLSAVLVRPWTLNY